MSESYQAMYNRSSCSVQLMSPSLQVYFPLKWHSPFFVSFFVLDKVSTSVIEEHRRRHTNKSSFCFADVSLADFQKLV